MLDRPDPLPRLAQRGGYARLSKYGKVLATATEEHLAAEGSNAKIAMWTREHKNTGGRAFSSHTRAPVARNAILKPFTISIIY